MPATMAGLDILNDTTTADDLRPPEGSYFVAAYPPFSCWRSDLADTVERRLGDRAAVDGAAPFGLYIHLPFCSQRCQFCYYLSYAGKSRVDTGRYLAALVEELTLYRRTLAMARRTLGFAYFGGGTPSLLPTSVLERLLAELQTVYPWDRAKEVTFECAPRSVTARKLRMLRAVGINRISIGVQQLNDEILQLNGRVHLSADVRRAYSAIRSMDFNVVNIDLMVGLVGETDRSFFESLEDVIQMNPDSVTIYQLEIPLNTPLYRSLAAEKLPAELANWAIKRDRLGRAFDRLEQAGYFLRSGYTAVKDTKPDDFVYQDAQYHGVDLIGIGIGAFSYFEGVHFQNHASWKPYLEAVESRRLPVARALSLDRRAVIVREFILQLKLGQVLSDHFREQFGIEIGVWFREPLESFANKRWLEWNDRGVFLTRAGMLRVDQMLPAFYLPEHRGLRYS